MADPVASPLPYSRAAHVIALLTALAIFPLVIVGAGVTSKEAGMAFPDWPTSDGALINPPGWFQNELTRWEHGHRLIGWVVGMLAIALTVVCWRRGAILRWAALATLVAIIVQGVLGGVRVTATSTELAMVHGIWGQVCFSLACAVAMISSRPWVSASPTESSVGGFTHKLSLAVIGAVFLQLVFGAALRHFNSDAALAAHLVWVVGVAFAIGWATLWIMANHPDQKLPVRTVQTLAVLLAIQMILGAFAFIVTVVGGVQSPFLLWAVPSAHVAVGALLLAGSVLLALAVRRSIRRAATAPSTTPEVNWKVA